MTCLFLSEKAKSHDIDAAIAYATLFRSIIKLTFFSDIVRMLTRMYVCMQGGAMTRRMTVVFHDDELYTYLKVEAARRHIAASDIVGEAVREWLDSREDAELLPTIEVTHAEWEEKGGRPWSEVEPELEEAVTQRERAAEAKSVSA